MTKLTHIHSRAQTNHPLKNGGLRARPQNPSRASISTKTVPVDDIDSLL